VGIEQAQEQSFNNVIATVTQCDLGRAQFRVDAIEDTRQSREQSEQMVRPSRAGSRLRVVGD
jgi:hypothetical protein